MPVTCFGVNKARSRRGKIVYYRGIFADVIVYVFAHLHTALRTEENMLDIS